MQELNKEEIILKRKIIGSSIVSIENPFESFKAHIVYNVSPIFFLFSEALPED